MNQPPILNSKWPARATQPVTADTVKVPFSFACRGARTVWLAVFMNDRPQQWPPPGRQPWSVDGRDALAMVREFARLSEVTPGFWRGSVALQPGWCEYSFLVHGEWLPDPAATEKSPDGAGAFNSARWIELIGRPETQTPQPARGAIRRRGDAARQTAA